MTAHYALEALANIEVNGVMRLSILIQVADLLLSAKKYAKSKVVIYEAKQLMSSYSEQISDRWKAYFYAISAKFELNEGDLIQAESLAMHSYAIYEILNEKLELMQIYRLLASIKFSQKKPEEALAYTDIAINISTDLKDYGYQQYVYDLIINYYEGEKQYKLAAKYLKQAQESVYQSKLKIIYRMD